MFRKVFFNSIGIRYIALLILFTIFFTGCSSKTLLPSAENENAQSWETYEMIETAYNKVNSFETTQKQLHKLGFDPNTSSNTKILNHLDILNTFLVNASVSIEDLDSGVRECLQNTNGCIAYRTRVSYVKKERFGNVLLDLFNFKKNTLTTGWSFDCLIVINNNLVVFKTTSSQPNIKTIEQKTNPLGPFQSMESLLQTGIE